MSVLLFVVPVFLLAWLLVVADGYLIAHRTLTRKPRVPTAKEEEDLLQTSPRQWIDDAEKKVENEF
jgi:hypothetical protein